MEGTLKSLKRAHWDHKGSPDFQNFTYNQFKYWQIKFILGICFSNVNSNYSIEQN